MGVDIYLKWNGQTEEEHGQQITGFSIASGHTGYLRTAYGGEFCDWFHSIFKGNWDKEKYTLNFEKEWENTVKPFLAEKLEESDDITKMWQIASIINFFALGVNKQKEGKKPWLYISY